MRCRDQSAVNLYIAKATPNFEDRLVRAALPTTPEEKLVRMKRCRITQQRTCMALSEVLLVWALFESRGLEVRKSDRFVGEFGKPMLRISGETVEFNISHSGSYALVGIDENPVGVDIQQWGRSYDQIARKIMPLEEYGAWTESSDKVIAFCEFWTRKESMLKWRGVGIAGLRDADDLLPESIGAYPVVAPQGYSAAACGYISTSHPNALRAQEIEVEMLLAQVERRQEAL